MKRHHLILGLAAVLIVGPGIGVLRTRTPEASYLTAPVERGDLRTSLTATGTLDTVTTVKVSSQISGRIAEVLVDFNETVRKDQPIVKLDPELFEAEVRRTEAGLDSANARVTLAKAALAQAEANLANVRSGDAVTAAELDSAKARAELARRDFERKRILAQGDTLSQSAGDRVAAETQSAEATLRAAQAKHAARKDVALSAEASLNMAKANVQVAEAAVKQQAADPGTGAARSGAHRHPLAYQRRDHRPGCRSRADRRRQPGSTDAVHHCQGSPADGGARQGRRGGYRADPGGPERGFTVDAIPAGPSPARSSRSARRPT